VGTEQPKKEGFLKILGGYKEGLGWALKGKIPQILFRIRRRRNIGELGLFGLGAYYHLAKGGIIRQFSSQQGLGEVIPANLGSLKFHWGGIQEYWFPRLIFWARKFRRRGEV